MASGTPEDRANAIELLDVTLPKWLKRPVVALAEDHGPLQTLRKLGPGPVPPALTARERLALMADDTSLGSWISSLVHWSEHDGENGPDAGRRHPRGLPAAGRLCPVAEVDGHIRASPLPAPVELSHRLRPLLVSAGVRIVNEGDEGEELYIVRSGEVACSAHGDHVVARVGEGSVFGELAVLDPAPRSADVAATTDTDLLVLDGCSFLLDLMRRRPEVAADILTMLVRRLRAHTLRGLNVHRDGVVYELAPPAGGGNG